MMIFFYFSSIFTLRASRLNRQPANLIVWAVIFAAICSMEKI